MRPLILALLTLLAIGCSSSDEIPAAQEVSWKRRPSEKPQEPPEAPSIEPKVRRILPKRPRPPWKGERVRALDVDHDAAAVVRRSRAQLDGDPEVKVSVRRAKARRQRASAAARRRAGDTIRRLRQLEAARRERLLAEANTRRTLHHAEVRVRLYLEFARARAQGDHPADVLRAAQLLAASAARRAQASAELAREAEADVQRAERFTIASLEQGVPVKGVRHELRQTMAQHTEILLIHAQAEAEATYAREAVARVDAAWSPLGAK